MAQAVSRRPLMAETRVRSQARPYMICGGQGGTWILRSLRRVSPVSVIPPVLEMHSFVCHRRYTISVVESAVK